MTLPSVKAKLLEGRKGLIVGIANDRSIAWGCAAVRPRRQNGVKGMERVKGIEPSSLAWEAKALPLSYTRDRDST